MSYWTYVRGTVTVRPLGRTQAEIRYILETVLDHLPRVTGSERNMSVYIIQPDGLSSSSSHTEFGEYGGYYDWKTLSTELQSEYILVLDGKLQDRTFDQTYRETVKWLCRLAKRVHVEDVLVEVCNDWPEQSTIIRNSNDVFGKMYEWPIWIGGGEPNWCEYLMWECARGYDYPMKLAYKYFNDPENDAEVERRIKWRDEE